MEMVPFIVDFLVGKKKEWDQIFTLFAIVESHFQRVSIPLRG